MHCCAVWLYPANPQNSIAVITIAFFIVVIRVYLPPARFYITKINITIKTDCAIAQPIFSVFVISLIDEMKVNPNTILRKTIIIPANAILKGFFVSNRRQSRTAIFDHPDCFQHPPSCCARFPIPRRAYVPSSVPHFNELLALYLFRFVRQCFSHGANLALKSLQLTYTT